MSMTSSRGSSISETVERPASIYCTWPSHEISRRTAADPVTAPDRTPPHQAQPDLPCLSLPIPDCYFRTIPELAAALHSGRLEQPRHPADLIPAVEPGHTVEP